jgi:two-component system response regulator YesN
MDIRLKCLEFVLWAEHLAYLSGGMTYHFTHRSSYLPEVMGFQTLEELRLWFVSKMTDASRNITVKKEEKSDDIVSDAKEYIAANYSRDISLDDVSRNVDVSPYYFTRLFKEETGVTFVEYLTTMRIDKAKEMLNASQFSMKEICQAVGYSDPNYFSRIFKKNVGVTPTEYRTEKGVSGV